MATLDLNKISARNFATRMEVQENIVRNRMESGGALTAQEMIDGVRISHADFLRLVELAKANMWRAAE